MQATGPSGYTPARALKSFVKRALKELDPHFAELSGAHRILELGRPYFDAKRSRPDPDNLAIKHLDGFPQVRALIASVHEALGHEEPQWESASVICRHYRSGASLTTHIDRPDLFTDRVYNVVLLNTSGSKLRFHAPEVPEWG